MTRTTRTAPKSPPLYARIRQILESARASAACSVNTTQVVVNWLIGREIVEEEQKGKGRADYGEGLLRDLAERLRGEYGVGYGLTNLKLLRKFYLLYAELPAVAKGHAARDLSLTSRSPGSPVMRDVLDGVALPIGAVGRLGGGRVGTGETGKRGHAGCGMEGRGAAPASNGLGRSNEGAWPGEARVREEGRVASVNLRPPVGEHFRSQRVASAKQESGSAF